MRLAESLADRRRIVSTEYNPGEHQPGTFECSRDVLGWVLQRKTGEGEAVEPAPRGLARMVEGEELFEPVIASWRVAPFPFRSAIRARDRARIRCR